MATNSYYVNGWAHIVMQSVTIIANLMTIIAFAKIRSLRTHTSNLLIYALSITDFMWGIFQFLYSGVSFVYQSGPPFGELGCKISVPFEFMYNVGNMLLVAISVDRVLLVSLDYQKYVKIMTMRRLKVIIAVCYLICNIGSAIELGLWEVAKSALAPAKSLDYTHSCPFPARRAFKSFGSFVTLFYFILPLILVGILSGIFVNRLIIRLRKNRQICVVNADVANQQNVTENAANEGQSAQKRYMKAAVTLAALVSAMCVSMLPYSLYILVSVLTGQNGSIAMELTVWGVVSLNPLLDPLFYAATQKDIREFYGAKIKRLMNRCGACRNPNL